MHWKAVRLCEDKGKEKDAREDSDAEYGEKVDVVHRAWRMDQRTGGVFVPKGNCSVSLDML